MDDAPRLSRKELRERGMLAARTSDAPSLVTETSELHLRRPSRREMREARLHDAGVFNADAMLDNQDLNRVGDSPAKVTSAPERRSVFDRFNDDVDSDDGAQPFNDARNDTSARVDAPQACSESAVDRGAETSDNTAESVRNTGVSASDGDSGNVSTGNSGSNGFADTGVLSTGEVDDPQNEDSEEIEASQSELLDGADTTTGETPVDDFVAVQSEVTVSEMTEQSDSEDAENNDIQGSQTSEDTEQSELNGNGYSPSDHDDNTVHNALEGLETSNVDSGTYTAASNAESTEGATWSGNKLSESVAEPETKVQTISASRGTQASTYNDRANEETQSTSSKSTWIFFTVLIILGALLGYLGGTWMNATFFSMGDVPSIGEGIGHYIL